MRPTNTPEKIRANLIERPDTGCLMWMLQTDRFGYGLASVGGRKRVVHLILWEADRGPVPDGYELDHTCETTGCANLDHLEPVTRSENCRRRHTQNGYTKGTLGPREGNGSLAHCEANHPEGCWYTRPSTGKGYCRRSAWRKRKAA